MNDLILTENSSQVLFALSFEHRIFDTIAHCSLLTAHAKDDRHTNVVVTHGQNFDRRPIFIVSYRRHLRNKTQFIKFSIYQAYQKSVVVYFPEILTTERKTKRVNFKETPSTSGMQLSDLKDDSISITIFNHLSPRPTHAR